MSTSIFRKLIYAVFAIVLLQSCNRDIEMYPQNDETSLAKKWYEDNGQPFPLEWSKAQLIKGNNSENSTLVVPLENGTTLGADNSMQQILVFNIEGNKVVKGNKVNFFSNTRTVAELSGVAISNLIKKQTYRSKDLGKVYFMVYDLNDTLLYSELMDTAGLKQVKLQLKISDSDNKVKSGNGNSVAGKNIPVVCSEWYLVEYFDDGTEYWTYLYTTCSGTASGGGGGGGGSNGGGSGAATSTYYEAPTEPINIQELLNCFNNIPSNAQTTYKVTIHTHLANPNNAYQVYNVSDKDPGHAYITMQKTNGSATRSLTFGFYPSAGSWMTAIKDAENSAIGQEIPQTRRSDGSYTISVSEAAFNNARNVAFTSATKKYDLNDFNCTNYAIGVFNAAMGGTGLQVPNSPIGYKTPSSLYLRLSDMKTGGTGGISLTPSMAPTSTTPCN